MRLSRKSIFLSRDFFRDLQQNLFMRWFTDDYFKTIVTIPKIEVYKCNEIKMLVNSNLIIGTII